MLDPDQARYLAAEIICALIDNEIAQPKLTLAGSDDGARFDILDTEDMAQIHAVLDEMKNGIRD